MSAVAAIASREGIVLLSDGITFHANESAEPIGTLKRSDCKIHSTDTSKIFTINSRVGVSWVGNMFSDLRDRFKQDCKSKGLTEPAQIAHHLSKLLKNEYKDIDISSIPGTYNNVNVSVTGFDKQGTPWGIGIAGQTDFAPDTHKLAQHGIQTTCMLPFINQNNHFDRLLEKHNKRTSNPKELAIAAFTEMIRDYEAEGMVVGGKIFCEVLRPPARFRFSQMIMN